MCSVWPGDYKCSGYWRNIYINYDQNHKDYELAREQCIDNVTDVCQKSLLSSETILQHLRVIHCVKLEIFFWTAAHKDIGQDNNTGKCSDK